jgi:hypothetical protein
MRTVERLDAEIYYEVHGENGPAVAHGRGGNAASWWQHWVGSCLSQSYRPTGRF